MFSNQKKQKQQKQSPWSQKKLSISNPFPRYGHSSNQSDINDELYIFGGFANGRVTNDIFMVEIDTLNCCGLMTTGDIPSPRSFHTQVNIGNNVIVFGGSPLNPIEKPDNNIYILNTATKQWYKPPIQGNPNVGRFGHSATVIGSKMYVFGGQSDGYFLDDLVVFDLQALVDYNAAQWEFITPINDSPTGRSGQTMCAYNDKIYVFGGTDGEKCYNDTWCYDTQSNTWSELSCIGYIPAPRKNHGAAIIDDVIYIFGGKGQDGLEMGDLVALRISNQRWYMFSEMGIAPSPRQGHVMISYRDKALVFGGECIQSPKPSEDGTINILDTSKIRYPSLQSPRTPTSQRMQQTSLEINRSPLSSPNQYSNLRNTNNTIDNNNNIDNNNVIPTRKSSMSPPNGQSPPNANEQNAYYSMPYDNRVKSQRQISPSGSQSSLNSPTPSPKLTSDNNNTNSSSPRRVQGGSPRNQFIKKPPNSPSNSLVEQKLSNENLRKQTPSPSDGRRQFQPQIPGSPSYEKLTNLPLHMAGAAGDFQHPRDAPRPPNSFNSSASQHSNNQYIISQHNSGSISPSSLISQNSLRSPTFDAIDHFPTPISNTERDNFLRELQNRDAQISQFKVRETWLKAELALARQAGYVFEDDHNKIPDGIDAENFMDIGETGTDRNKIMSAAVRLKQELRRAKATIANQAQVASQKITDAERARTAAIQEAVYFKAKLNALLNSSEQDLVKIEIERAEDLEKRLTQALKEKDLLQTKITQFQQNSTYDKNSRKSAEEREKSATIRAEEAEGAHARALAELATLHSRTTTAEAQLRENNIRLAEATAELSLYRSSSDNSRNELENLQQSLDQYKNTLEKTNHAVLAANERANEAESLWRQARQDNVSLEKESAGLRAELDIKMRDLDRTHARSNEMERLLVKAQKEVDAVRSMMQEGMTELLNTSRSNKEGNNNSEASKKITMLEQEISNLKSAYDTSQTNSQETSNSLADAMVKISQMEGAAMKARSDSATLQRKLVEASDENARTKDRLREKELLLTETTRALEDAEVKVGMMRNVMTERGILDDSGNNDNRSPNRIKELELKYDELENMHNKAIKKAKDAEEKAKILEIELERAESKNTTPDSSRGIEDDLKLADTLKSKEELTEMKQKLRQVEDEYQTAVRYVKSTEKMLRKMKEELSERKKEVGVLNEKLSTAQKRNEELEDKLSETENNILVRKGLHDSTSQKLDEQRSEFIKEKEHFQEKINDLQSQLERSYNEKNMTDAEYEILRKEYEILRKENESLQSHDQDLRKSLKDSQKALRGTQNELNELYSNVSKEFNSMRSGTKGKNWDESRTILERQIVDYRSTNEKLAKENSDLEQKWRESENKIALLLDQMEHAVGSYREIEDDIRDSSPRNSNIISSMADELDMLNSRYDNSNQDQDTEFSDEDFIDANWGKLPNNDVVVDDDVDDVDDDDDDTDTDRMIAALEKVQKVAEQRNLGNSGSYKIGSVGRIKMNNMLNDDSGSHSGSASPNADNNSNNNNRILNTSPNKFTKGNSMRMIDHIRGQLSLTPPPIPPTSQI